MMSLASMGRCVAIAGLAGVCSGGTDEPRWALIGDPGNPDTTDEDSYWSPQPPVGAVEYEYRISILELTVGEYLEFVEAYRPFYFKRFPERQSATSDFEGFYFDIQRDSIRYFVPDRRAANMGWEYAARYVNWLHHGKVNESWAFETGVFDTSTFKPDLNGEYH